MHALGIIDVTGCTNSRPSWREPSRSSSSRISRPRRSAAIAPLRDRFGTRRLASSCGSWVTNRNGAVAAFLSRRSSFHRRNSARAAAGSLPSCRWARERSDVTDTG